MENCPECGASMDACKARFDELLALEFTRAAYGAVHHLTVAAYLLQHSSNLTPEGWLYQRGLLNKFLCGNKPPAFIRRQNRDTLDSRKRSFKLKSKTGLPVIRRSTWSMTILDVPVETPEAYCAGVRAWAGAVLGDAESLEPE
jgi:hypothetical protein